MWIFIVMQKTYELARKCEEEISDLGSLVEQVKTFNSTREFDGNPEFRIAILSNFTTDYIEMGIPLFLSARNISAEIKTFGYDSWKQQILNSQSELYEFKPSHVLLLLTSIELIFDSNRENDEIVETLISMFSILRAKGIEVIFTLPEALEDEIGGCNPLSERRRNIVSGIREKTSKSGTMLIDIDPLIRQIGSDQWYSSRMYKYAKLPFNGNKTRDFLKYICDEIKSSLTTPLKLVIVDFDDTIWGGEVGEIGPVNVDLDPKGEGLDFLRIQYYLRDLRNRGVILAACSKNYESVALEVFNARPEMILRLSDFVSFRINWNAKSENIASILQELNLTPKSVMFLDNSKYEREEVRAAHPEILVPELPDDVSKWISYLHQIGVRFPTNTTIEGSSKTEMYAAEKVRRDSIATFTNLDDFLESLKMELTMLSGLDHVDRVVELLRKTNQFNLTGAFINRSDLLSDSNGYLVVCFRLSDKFGESGIISTLVMEKLTQEKWSIYNWVMSCRVMNRGIEKTILSMVAEILRREGAIFLYGKTKLLPKNEPVRNLLETLGFKKSVESEWEGASYIDVTQLKITGPIAEIFEL